MITRLEANHYRCFENLGVELGAFRVIVGSNGSGKTTLIDIPVLLGDLLKSDNLASVFVVKQGQQPPRASSLRELIFAGRGDDFSLAIEAELPEEHAQSFVAALIGRQESKKAETALRNSPDRWPTHIRYELRLEVFNERELNVKNEYLFVFPESFSPDRAIGGLYGEANQDKEDWHFILKREYGGLASFNTELDPLQGTSARVEQARVKANLLAMPIVKYRSDSYPAANWLYELLTENAVFLNPDWEMLRAASPPGQESRIISSGLNLPWLALALKLKGSDPDTSLDEKAVFRSQDYSDWIEHVKTALAQIEDIEVKEREEDHHAYFNVRYSGGYSVTSSGLSDGTLRILMLTLLAYVSDPPTVIVTEEPENGIHPSAIEAILESLSSLYDSQVWITSHSPVVLASSELDQLLCARQTSSGGVEVVSGDKHPRLIDWHGAIDLGSLFAAGILG